MDSQVIKRVITETNFINEYSNKDLQYRDTVSFENLWWNKATLLEFRNNHQISRDEEIFLIFNYKIFHKGDFFTADRTYCFCTMFFKNRISFFKTVNTTGWDKEKDLLDHLEIDSIESVEVYEESIRFYFYNENNYSDYPSACFGKKTFTPHVRKTLEDFFTKLIQVKKEIETDQDDYFKEYTNNFNEAITNSDFSKALEISNSYNDLEPYFSYQFDRGHLFLLTNKFSESFDILQTLRETSLDLENEHWYSRATILQSELYEINEDYYTALELFEDGFKLYDDPERSGFWSKERAYNLYQKYINIFPSLQYKEKKVIYLSSNNEKYKTDNLVVLEVNNLPNIKFPPHHPIKNELYIGHPFNENCYVSINNYDYELLTDRINEYCYLLQCLGASSISIENIKGEDSFNSEEIKKHINVDASVIKAGINVDHSSSNNTFDEKQNKLKVAKSQNFNPTKEPYIPAGLVWYPHETSWQRLAEQRLQGNLLDHTELISSQESQILNTNEINDLKVDVSAYLAKVNVENQKEVTIQIKNSSITEWRVKVVFRPISDIRNSNDLEPTKTIIQIDQTEEEYLEELDFLLEESDQLLERDLRILDRHRTRLGISEERAKELIDSRTKLTDEELDFIEEIKFYLEDGEISEREELLLIRLGKRLGLEEDNCRKLISKYN
ncbi:hypothetical protein [Myroides phaeus]|uniref:Tetratricopeptide repeat-containing protein n=1 Tax=Myroides phaeus TaxID=702745 RepID=A0A1G8FSK0_9FLAO|nr:hypothetical protein [Myroides phaeus]SDH85103.1 hypothetical protein SAMN05421818_1192 [Myroides phaeus]